MCMVYIYSVESHFLGSVTAFPVKNSKYPNTGNKFWQMLSSMALFIGYQINSQNKWEIMLFFDRNIFQFLHIFRWFAYNFGKIQLWYRCRKQLGRRHRCTDESSNIFWKYWTTFLSIVWWLMNYDIRYLTSMLYQHSAA